MKLSSNQLDDNYHYSELEGGNTTAEYIRHNVDVFNVITVEGIELQAVYQTGLSWPSGDYNNPSTELALSEAGGASTVLVKIDGLYDSDFENEDREVIDNFLEDIKEHCSILDTVEKVRELYHVLNGNLPKIDEYCDPDLYTDDIEDYVEGEHGILTPKFLNE